MKRKPSIILVFAVAFALIIGYVFFKITTGVGIFQRLGVAFTMALCGAVFGAIIGFVFRVIFGPSKTQRLLQKQNEILSKHSKSDSVEQLYKLNKLRENGSITEEEFNKLKKDILNK